MPPVNIQNGLNGNLCLFSVDVIYTVNCEFSISILVYWRVYHYITICLQVLFFYFSAGLHHADATGSLPRYAEGLGAEVAKRWQAPKKIPNNMG